jgi:hypothetical protein
MKMKLCRLANVLTGAKTHRYNFFELSRCYALARCGPLLSAGLAHNIQYVPQAH